MTLLEFLLHLIGDNSEDVKWQDWFREDPEAALRGAGLEHLTAEDVHDAAVLIQDNDTASFDRNYDTGSNHLVAAASAPPVHRGHDGGHGGHEGHAEGTKGAIEYINRYITNNYVDDRDTIVDNSVNQQINTHGGDFDQDIDIHAVTASGDGAVAAGGDIRDSNVVTGNGNVVGKDNQVVSGNDNTTAFGSGDANSASFDNVSVSGGGAISVGGNASGSYDVDGSFNHTTTTTTNTTKIDDSFNTDYSESHHYDYTDNSQHTSNSNNDTDVLSHNRVDADVHLDV